MAEDSPVSRALEALGIPHRVFVHSEPLTSLKQAAEERGQRPEQVVRSLLFRKPGEHYVMVLVAGSRQIDWKKLRRTLRTSRITMASQEKVLEITGYELGAVAPFGLPQPVQVLVDRSVLAEGELSMGSGVRNVAILLKQADLMRALEAVEIVEVG